jgi:transposase
MLLRPSAGEASISRVTKACSHLSGEEIRARRKKTKDWRGQQKLLVILNALADPRRAEEIALHTGVARQTVYNWISTYNRFGFDALIGPGRGERCKAMMSKEEEMGFLAPFFQRAETGRIATAGEIREAWENRVGHAVHETSVYRFLKRNGWRKVKPRSYHVQTDAQAQEDFKKTSINALRRCLLAAIRLCNISRPILPL